MPQRQRLYFALIAVFCFLNVAGIAAVLFYNLSVIQSIVLLACGIFALIGPALAITNLIFILAESALPEGPHSNLPANSRAVILVPCLLVSQAANQRLLDKLLEHFRSTTDDAFGYALLSDFTDFTEEHRHGEADLLRHLSDGVELLNKKYGDRFAVLHRDRQWNPTESKWMGRERKRGKLEDFAAMRMTGDAAPFSVIVGASQYIRHADYALVLDADSVLPPGAARELLDEIVALRKEAVDLVQPNVFPTASEPTTFYQWIMSPLFPPLSIYQYVFGESWYAGKAIFDIRAFHEKLAKRLPDNWILSHDTIESCFLKVAASRRAYVRESNPVTHLDSALRSHRWYRGDWQLLPWLLPRFINRHIAECRDYTVTPISYFGRWKLFECLVRGLGPVSLLAWSIGVLTMNVPGSWIVFPAAIDLLTAALVTAGMHLSMREPVALSRSAALFVHVLVRAAYVFVTLPHYAGISIDALCRAQIRMFITGRKRLEWIPFSTGRDNERLFGHYLKMWQCWVLGLLAVYKYLTHPGQPVLLVIGILWIAGPCVAWLAGYCSLGARAPEDSGQLLETTRRAEPAARAEN